MNAYYGIRTEFTVRVFVMRKVEEEFGLPHIEPLRHVVYHSPDGFNWGYSGSGPCDLGLSILADYFKELPTIGELAVRVREIPDDEWRRAEGPHDRAVLIEKYLLKSWLYHLGFTRHFLDPISTETFMIDDEAITRWLLSVRPAGAKKERRS